jgi:hypothetical protein
MRYVAHSGPAFNHSRSAKGLSDKVHMAALASRRACTPPLPGLGNQL